MTAKPIGFCVSEGNHFVQTRWSHCLRFGGKLCLHLRRFSFRLFVLTAAVFVLFQCAFAPAQADTPPVSAKTVYVNDTMGDDAWDGLASEWDGIHGPKKTIQDGIDASTDGDVVIVADGTYEGPDNRDLDFGGRATILRSENGPENTIIDCEGSGRGFYFRSQEAANTVVDGFTISNGNAERGGGIACRNNSGPTIMNCTIMGNSAGEGGGIVCQNNSMPTLINCTIMGNSTYGDGGGIYCRNNSMPTLTNCMITNNSSDDDGGGIYCWNNGEPKLTNCTISSNSAENGGGIYCRPNSRPTFTNCILWGNSPEEIRFEESSSPRLDYCDIQGGWSGAGTGNMSEDPRLTADGHLGAGSACIDAGTHDGAPSDDIDGEARPFGVGVDIGADEFAITDPNGLRLFWQSSSGLVAYWLLNSDGTLRSSGRMVEGPVPTERVIRASGDIDRDGTTDLIWQAADGSVLYWLLNVDGTLKSSGDVISGSVSTGWVICASGDIDQDGTVDLIWQSSNGGVACWLLNSDGTLRLSKRIGEDSVPIEWRIVAAGDIDGNGAVDLFWRNMNSGWTAYWMLNTDGTRKGAGRIGNGPVPFSWRIEDTIDINGDNIADLLWRNSLGQLAYWEMSPDGTLRGNAGFIGGIVDLSWQVVATDHIDGDGITDLIWRNNTTGDVAYWLIDPNAPDKRKAAGIIGYKPLSWEIKAVSR